MKIKNIISKIAAFAAAIFFVVPVAGCSNTPSDKVNVYMPDGAPAVALAYFMHDGYDNTDFTVVPSDEIRGYVANGTADMAIMPVNAAAALYNANKSNPDRSLVMLTVNTHGNLYILGDGEQIKPSALVGKRLGAIGMGAVPDFTLRLLLEGCGIDFVVSDTAVEGKVAIRYGADGGAVRGLLAAGAVDYAMLAEPAVTGTVNALHKAVVLDVQSAWADAFGTDYPQACLVAKRSFVNENKAYVDKFIADLKASDGWAKDNARSALDTVKAHMKEGTESTLPMLNAAVVTRCNIKTVEAQNAKAACKAYFEKLTTLKIDELGTFALAAAPDDGFYYSA